LSPPIDDIEAYWTPSEKAQASRMLACAFVGAKTRVFDELSAFQERVKANEFIVAGAIFDPVARLRSYEILAEAFGLSASP